MQNPFSASPLTAGEVLQQRLGGAAYSVPEYQREYRWPIGNIQRLVEDIVQGLFTHADTSKQLTVTFIGTIILVGDNESAEPSFGGQSLSVVDGQQRLTTLALLLCRIDAYCYHMLQNLDETNPFEAWLIKELHGLRKTIFPCIATGNFNLASTDPYKFVPKITRAADDIRAHSTGEANYTSPVAKYIFSYIKFILAESADKPAAPPAPPEASTVNARINAIDENIAGLYKSSNKDEELAELLPKLFDRKPFRKLFRELTERHSDLISDLSRDVRSNLSEDAQKAVLVTAFSNYLLFYVQMIFVDVSDEQYAFEVFEALNTTGESLTAFETFKPIVIRKENSGDTRLGYSNSTSKESFARIQSYAESFGSGERQRGISEILVTSLALYVSGKKTGRHLAEQRKYLQETYSRQGTADKRQAFVRAPIDLIEYRERFWDSPSESVLVNLGGSTQTVYACASFLSASGTNLSIPILARFWRAYKDGRIEEEEYAAFFKAVTAFVALRRAATGGTKNIDGDLRLLMQKGDVRHSAFAGLSLNLDNDTTVPSLTDFTAALRYLLQRRPINVQNRQDWIGKASANPLYIANSPLCKFLLLAASHSSQGEAHTYPELRPVTESINNKYLTFDVWTAPDTETVEHIAPQKGSGSWSSTIYTEPDLVHTLGNLMLFPKAHNTSLSNGGPDQKWPVYKALAALDKQAREAQIIEAKKRNAEIKPKLERAVLASSRLPLVASVAEFNGQWTADVIKQRSRNITERAWDSIAPWLGFAP